MEDELELGWAFQLDADGTPHLAVDNPNAFIVKMEGNETAEEAETRVRAGIGKRLAQTQVKNVVALASTKLITGFVGTALSKTAIKLLWRSYGGAASYLLQYSTDGLEWTTLPKVTSRELNVTSLTAATLYNFRIRAINKQGTAISPWSTTTATTLLGLEAITGTTTTTPIGPLTGIGYNASLNFDVLNLLLSYTEPIQVQLSRGDDIIYGTILGTNAGKFNQAGDPWLGYNGRIRLDRAVPGKDGIKPGDVITVRIRAVANRNLTFVYIWTVAAVTSTAAVALELTGTNSTSRLQVFGEVTFTVTTPDPEPDPEPEEKVYPAITNRLFVYNLMNPDGPGYPGGSVDWSQYGTTKFMNGTEHIPAYIDEWVVAGGNAFSTLIPWQHYQSGKNQFRSTLIYENQRARIRQLGKQYFVRFNLGRQDVNTDPIINPGNVALFQDGSPAQNGGGYGLRLDLLKAYVNGGSTDTDNPWHEAKRFILKLANDFKPDILDDVCLGLSFTLNTRQEDGIMTDQGPNSTLLLSDYSASAIADFKATMGVSQNPPGPSAYLGRDAFIGSVGVKWYIYREQMYLYFKNWVRGLINSVVPGCPNGEDYGIIRGAHAANGAIANVTKISAGSRLVKVNPDEMDFAQFAIDHIRSVAPAGAHLAIELDTSWIIDKQTGQPVNVNDVAQKCGVYWVRGAGSLWWGQMGGETAFNQAKLTLIKCLELGQAGAITTPARPGTAHRATYTMQEALTGDENIIFQRWYGAGGFDAPTEIAIIDNLT
ncbi:fibronectin type III domain-containing protein [Fibrella sp. ES10-3-2-2]|nr:hypothetical protein A6C57_00365 [Fibrella sp. ES10-3-2-2]